MKTSGCEVKCTDSEKENILKIGPILADINRNTLRGRVADLEQLEIVWGVLCLILHQMVKSKPLFCNSSVMSVGTDISDKTNIKLFPFETDT